MDRVYDVIFLSTKALFVERFSHTAVVISIEHEYQVCVNFFPRSCAQPHLYGILDLNSLRRPIVLSLPGRSTSMGGSPQHRRYTRISITKNDHRNYHRSQAPD
jgi:hypothetical protein